MKLNKKKIKYKLIIVKFWQIHKSNIVENKLILGGSKS